MAAYFLHYRTMERDTERMFARCVHLLVRESVYACVDSGTGECKHDDELMLKASMPFRCFVAPNVSETTGDNSCVWLIILHTMEML